MSYIDNVVSQLLASREPTQRINPARPVDLASMYQNYADFQKDQYNKRQAEFASKQKATATNVQTGATLLSALANLYGLGKDEKWWGQSGQEAPTAQGTGNQVSFDDWRNRSPSAGMWGMK